MARAGFGVILEIHSDAGATRENINEFMGVFFGFGIAVWIPRASTNFMIGFSFEIVFPTNAQYGRVDQDPIDVFNNGAGVCNGYAFLLATGFSAAVNWKLDDSIFVISSVAFRGASQLRWTFLSIIAFL